MSAIDTHRFFHVSDPRVWRVPGLVAVGLLALIVQAIVMYAIVPLAYAGTASTGELAFFPCTKCHPVAVGSDGEPTGRLPNGFKKHEIKLEVHDILGTGDTACLACHESPQKNPGKLILPDGSTVDVNGDVSRVCQRCHFEKYRQWKTGVHGKNAPKCSAAGCHNPHTPSWIYVAALPPFQGTGMEVRAVGEREGFKPLAPPPVDPPVETPLLLTLVTVFGGVVSLGMVAYLVKGRSPR